MQHSLLYDWLNNFIPFEILHFLADHGMKPLFFYVLVMFWLQYICTSGIADIMELCLPNPMYLWEFQLSHALLIKVCLR